MYSIDNDVLETILLQKTMNEDYHFFNFGLWVIRVTCISNS